MYSSLLGSKVRFLKIFLTALAIIDDLGAIIVIALLYKRFFINLFDTFNFSFHFSAGFKKNESYEFDILYPTGNTDVVSLKSGIHPTITGVLLAFAIPFKNTKGESPSVKLEHSLIKPVSFIVLPLFALANTGIIFSSGWYNEIFFFKQSWDHCGIIP